VPQYANAPRRITPCRLAYLSPQMGERGVTSLFHTLSAKMSDFTVQNHKTHLQTITVTEYRMEIIRNWQRMTTFGTPITSSVDFSSGRIVRVFSCRCRLVDRHRRTGVRFDQSRFRITL